ncbi:virB8 family protein [Rhodanobacter lindaniclasticus]|uniref:Conjugative transfer protein n=1 Tax=Rhodanobacter lindaniclasticus TaxID=75310 RepID=A0A4S3KM59_9GAMM|nr:type IV secretion system protein [Rhodanobacter lindaniclasticus]THD09977.1 conjugative transfer protein [Rhodanobacter lindaniclasticus]
MARKPTSGSAIERSIAQSTRFELTIAELARRSERRAWWVAWTAVALALALSGGYYFMLPLKQRVPYLVMADAYTGTATVARLDGDFAMRGITTREAVNRSNVAHFVLARESYDLELVNLRDWKTVQTMASAGVKAPYVQLFANSNPDSLIKQFGKDQAIRIKLLSIQLVGGGPGKTPRGATVRFQRSLYNKQNGATRPLDNKIATIAFTYKQNLEMDDQSRVENPLGFWVTSYRVDDDYAMAPPPEVSVSPATTQPAPAMAAASAPAAAPPAAAATDTLPGAGPR